MTFIAAADTYRLLPGRLRITIDGLRRNPQFARFFVCHLEKVEGVKSVTANPVSGRALILFDQEKLPISLLFREIAAISHKPGVKPTTRALLQGDWRAVEQIPAASVANTVLTGGVLAGILVKRALLGTSPLASSSRVFNLAAITTIIAGYPLLQSGLAKLGHKKEVNAELVVFMSSLFLLAIRESVTGLAVMWVVHLNNLFRHITENKNRHRIRRLLSAKPQRVYRIRDGRFEMVAADEIKPGDIIAVNCGERILADGEVVSGKATVNQSNITGEYMSTAKCKGDVIYAGALVEAGSIKIHVDKVGQETLAGRILSIVDQAVERAPRSHRNDEIAGNLGMLTLGVAVAIFFITRDFNRSMAILLAGCPATITIARQAALGSSLASAASRGIFVKDARYLEQAGSTDTVLFDKTGTLTSCCPQIGEVRSVSRKYSDGQILQLAASAEKHTSHPLARMLAQEAGKRGMRLLSADSELIVGYGVRAKIQDDQVSVGSAHLMKLDKIDIRRVKTRVGRYQNSHEGILYVGVNGKIAGIIGVHDTMRPESRDAIEQLRNMGVNRIGLITGDRSHAAAIVAEELGITDQWSEMLPGDKVQKVKNLRQDGHTVMLVGDGINDSPAMSAADIGVALGADGNNDAIMAADIVITGNNPFKAAELIRIGQKVNSVVRQSTLAAAGLNLSGIALAAFGIISPVSAAIGQNLATLAIVINSSRLYSSRDRLEEYRRSLSPPAKTKVIDLVSPSENQEEHQSLLDLQRFAGDLTKLAEAPGEWHTLTLQAVCEQLNTSPCVGLSSEQVGIRQLQHGLNKLAEGKKLTFWQMFVQQFKDFMVQVLVGASVLSFVLGKPKDALLTVAIVIANALLGVFQERRAENSIAALQTMAAPEAKVMRGGKVQKVKTDQIVPGDIIVLEAGDRVPADARLVASTYFEVEEASLTGETIPAKKNHQFNSSSAGNIGDRKNMIFMATNVTRGSAIAVVTSTGMKTEMGKIADMIQQNGSEITPLQRRLEELGRFLVFGCLVVSGIILALGLLRGETLLNMLQTAASLAVAAIPEGLTAMVIIALAMGVQRMSKRNIIIRKLSSIETLGCATIICSDKTGTLTRNEMTVRSVVAGSGRVYQVTGDGYVPEGKFLVDNAEIDPAKEENLMMTLLAATLCNNAKLSLRVKEAQGNTNPITECRAKGWCIHGDPTEGALVVAAAKAALWSRELEQTYSRIREFPFDSDRRMMSIIFNHKIEGKVLFCKGAPDTIVEHCTHYYDEGRIVPLDEQTRQVIMKANADMTDRALRVLATAFRKCVSIDDCQDEKCLEHELIFCGLIGMVDPPRAEVPEAIQRCRSAGIKVAMITGDHPNTAKAIARELGLVTDSNGLVVLGQEIDRMSDEQLSFIAEKTAVYARTSPHHKLRIVKALREKGYIVAMTGDGVNDAPAVKAADIGIAMGITGTDVTKEAASMTLADDNFATIVNAVEQGRAIYANIRKAIRYLIATNIGEVLLMLFAVMLGLPLPLLPIQLLWINLIGDGLPAIALVNDPPTRDIMIQQPRRARDGIFTDGLGRKILTRGFIMGLASLALFRWKLAAGNLAAARSMVVANVAVSQFFHLFDCRVEHQSGKMNLLSNKHLIGAVALSMLMVVGIIHLPFLQTIFSTVALMPGEWMTALLVAGIISMADMGINNLWENRKSMIVPRH